MKRAMRIALPLAALLAIAGVAMASGGGEAAGEGVAMGWSEIDTYRVMNFAVLAIGLFFILRKPASAFLGGRIEEIEGRLAGLEQRKADAERSLRNYRAKLEEMDKEADRIVASYIEQGEQAKARILKEAEASAVKMREQAARNIEYEFARARAKLQDEVMEKALEKAEKLVRKKVTKKDQERLVGEYLEKVVA